jgi:large subunit ribosomal protein L29
MGVIELRKLSQEDLEEELNSSRKELFSLRIQKGSGQLPKPHLLRAVRKRIAQLHTLISEKI